MGNVGKTPDLEVLVVQVVLGFFFYQFNQFNQVSLCKIVNQGYSRYYRKKTSARILKANRFT